ncbi:CAP domain-containing protein [Streptomyces sp. NPDC015131]|uniref:CAP domain-containing protein n=1 Tax=Streptomyces sp. NPDC015131 TaxID=3364941 RepID=UPI0036FEEA51
MAAAVALVTGAFDADQWGGPDVRVAPPAATPSPAAPTAPDPALPVPAASVPASAVPAAGRAVAAAAATRAERVVALVNAARAKAGCRPVRPHARLRDAAQGHADDMAARHYYAHDSPEGRDAGDRMEAAGYAWRVWGENIHRGPKDPGRAVRDWLASPGHRKNIVNCEFKDIGVGVSLRSNGPWWVQVFGLSG